MHCENIDMCILVQSACIFAFVGAGVVKKKEDERGHVGMAAIHKLRATRQALRVMKLPK